MDRLRRLGGFYEPQPPILVVDFGSAEPYRSEVAAVCNDCGFELHYVDDSGVYSASMAHNAAFAKVRTDYIFFLDIDFIGARDLFSQLARTANAARMNGIADVILNLPAYHVSERLTAEIVGCEGSDALGQLIEQVGYSSQFSEFGDEVEFIAPYSNVLLISKKMFNMSGGYHTAFRGHGSEDFEFFVRLATLSMFYPTPKDVRTDCYGPTKWDFWKHREYHGFRSLNQLIASRAERAGLKIFHLWHPTSREHDWRKDNDWKRDRLNSVLNTYLGNNFNLLSTDGLKRGKTAVCICKDRDAWGYFIPLRAHGYDIVPVNDDSIATMDIVNDMFDRGEVDALAIFNPYMKSNAKFFPLFLRAKDNGVKTVVIERGALPGTIYYADDVSYTSPLFSESSLSRVDLSPGERKMARAYIGELRSGEFVLEDSATKAFTDRKYRAIGALNKKIALIPLQLHDDMAVTKYVRDSQPYERFQKSIQEIASKNSDILFIVKPHPLSKIEVGTVPENVIIADRSDNIHSLIDIADGVVCYNSGVGLLAACHGKILVTVGNAFYNLPGIGHFAATLNSAVSTFKTAEPASEEAVVELIGRYIFYRYSWFAAVDNIREFKERKAHGYRNIQVNRSVLDGIAIDHIWENCVRPLKLKSYGMGMLNWEAPTSAPTARNTGTSAIIASSEAADPERAAVGLPSGTVDARQLRHEAFSAYSAGDFDKAAKLYERIAALDQTIATPHREAAEALFRSGRVGKAIESLENAKRIAPDNKAIVRRIKEMRRPAWIKKVVKDRPFPLQNRV